MKPTCFAKTNKHDYNSLKHVDFSTKAGHAIQLLNRANCTEHCRSKRVHEHLMKFLHCE